MSYMIGDASPGRIKQEPHAYQPLRMFQYPYQPQQYMAFSHPSQQQFQRVQSFNPPFNHAPMQQPMPQYQQHQSFHSNNHQPNSQSMQPVYHPSPVVPTFDQPIHPFNGQQSVHPTVHPAVHQSVQQTVNQPFQPMSLMMPQQPQKRPISQSQSPLAYPQPNIGPALPITIVRLTRKHIKLEGTQSSHLIQSRVKCSEVNYMQRIQGTLHVPAHLIRGEGKLLIRISTRDSHDTNSLPTPLRPSKQFMYDVRPFFDYTFNECSGFSYSGDQYWNNTVKSGELKEVSCVIGSVCERIEFTGSIVRPDASYNKRQNFWNSVTLQIDWLPNSSSVSTCCWCETMRGHRRVSNHVDRLNETEVSMPMPVKESSRKRARKADTMTVKSHEID